MHEIEIIREDRLTVTMMIDGREITLTRKGNPKTLYSPALISADLDMLLHLISCSQPISSGRFHLAGTNIIRMIDVFCLNEAVVAWEAYAKEKITYNSMLLGVFYEYLGFVVSSHLENSPFFLKGSQIGAACKKKAILERHRMVAAGKTGKPYVYHSQSARNSRNIIRKLSCDADGVRVEYVAQENNTVTYLINSIPVSFCTSSRALTLNAQSIHDAVRTIQEALVHSQIEMLDPVIGLMGGKAVLSIMAALYMDQSRELLISYARKQYVDNRELPTPRKLFKSVFHNNLRDLTPAYELLAAVESVIPEATEYLVSASVDELMSDKSQWILYYLRANNPFRRTVAFHHSEGINQEVRNFLRNVAQIRITSQTEYVVLVYDNWYYIDSGLRILTESGVHLNSILDIQPTDCLYLQSCLAQRSEYKEKTQRHIIQVMMRFYNFTAKRSGITGKSPFDYIHLPKRSEGKHTPPITAEALELIKDRISSLPAHFRIAFTIAILTGARASSICLLTTDAIVQKEDGYELVMQNKKTEMRHTMSNRPTFTRWKLPDEFVKVLFDYIESTKEIRSKLDVPYLLVYYPPNYRTGSKRPPAVLTPSTFADQIAKLMRDTPLYRTDGTPVKCNFMSIRAEFGRAMFASGATADDVARALGNTAPVAATNYNTMSAKDEAELYHQHYDAAFAPMREQIKARYEKEENVILLSDHISPKPVMYGNCTSNDNKQCSKNNCDECPQRIVCRQEREVVMR